MQEQIKNIEVSENIKKYIVKLVEVTRQKNQDLQIGASTR
jgi:MoxR-like ATPase